MVKRNLMFICAYVFLAAHQASATLPRQLPASSHYEGFVFYDEEWEDWFGESIMLRGRIDFAVYDTWAYPNEFIGTDGFENPGNSRYIHAHQIFNDYEGFSESPLDYFAVLGIDEVDGFGPQEDPMFGVEPSEAYFTGDEMVWEFGYDWIDGGEHSQFLVLSNNIDWLAGSYEIRHPVPEPATLILFALGGLVLRRKKR